MRITVKNKDRFFARLDEADELISRLRKLLSWDMPSGLEVELELEPSDKEQATSGN